MKILVGYRPTPQGRAALEAAVAEARLNDAELIISQHVPIVSSQDHGAETPAVRDALKALEDEVRSQGVSCRSTWSVGTGSGAKTLLEQAKDENVDLLVIGITRRSPVGKALLGSDAQDILLGADVPVLAVKAGHDDW